MAKRPGNPRPKLNSGDVLDVIESIEKKPHATYIKYLLTKRAGLNMITDEMHKLGLSCPSTEYLKRYFVVQIEPLIKKNGISALYTEYKAKINGRTITKSKKGTKNEFISSILKYAVDIGDDPVLQAKFCTFIKDLGVEVPWAWEIHRYHGTVENFPKDSNGVRILSSGLSKTNINRVASSPNRSIIEKLMLQNISNARISKYCKEHLKEDISDKDLGAFREVFFNTKLNSLEDNIKMLADEKNAQLAIIHDIKQGTSEYEEMSIGERAELERIINRRINEIDENLRAINAAYNDLSYDAKAESENNFEAMFADIAKRAYRKYCSYDNANDRDVAGPLAQVSKVMIAAHDKIEKIRESANSTKSSSLDDDGIKHSIGTLYHKRLDEIEAEEKEKANERLKQSGMMLLDDDVNPDEIGGVDELGAEFKIEDEDEE
jgi:hypothetical protein